MTSTELVPQPYTRNRALDALLILWTVGMATGLVIGIIGFVQADAYLNSADDYGFPVGDSGVAAIVTGGVIFGFAIFALFFYLAVKAMQWRPTLVTPAVAQAIRDAVEAPKKS